MPRYEVTLTIDFVGEIEAESREDDETCQYFGINDIEVCELDEEEEGDED